MNRLSRSTIFVAFFLLLLASVANADVISDDELARWNEIGIHRLVTSPPSGEIRNCAEWEPSEGVIIRYPLGIPVSLVAEMSESVTIWTIVSSTYYKNQAISNYTSAGVNMDNVDWIMASTDTYWTRDYGPWFIFTDQEMGIVDHVYNRPRPLDDVIPQTIGSQWGISVYGMDLTHTGGNHMSNGLGTSMSSRLIWDENPSLSPSQINDIMAQYLGNDYEVLGYIESGGIHHIDCWAKFLSPNTILVKDVPSGSSSYDLLNDRADYLSQQMSPWGEPYNVVRVYCPYGTAYTNSLILNDKVFVPMFNDSYDDDAIQTYQDAMPGYEVLGFYYYSFLDDDAIHCRTMGVPDREMLFIRHVPLHDTNDTSSDRFVTVRLDVCSGAGLISDSLKIYYSVNSGAYTSAPLYSTVEPDSFYGHIPAQGPGSQVSYFIRAADLSGRVENHPYIGEAWAHEYTITAANNPPEIATVAPQEVDEGENLNFVVSSSDPDGTTPALTAESMPLNADFTDNGDGTGLFDFDPDYSQAGSYFVMFIANDGSLADTEYVNITVNDINLPPSIVEVDTLLCMTEDQFAYYPGIEDLDDTTHVITYSLYPGWMSVSNDSLVGTAPVDAENGTFRVVVSDEAVSDSADVDYLVFLCGDADGSGGVDIDDAVFLITYIFAGGAEPHPPETGDVNCAGGIDIDDAVYLINYIFSAGPEPCANCI